MSEFVSLALFAGCGASDLGLERTGHFETEYMVEWEAHACKLLRQHFPNATVFEADISDVFGNWLNKRWPNVVTMSFPCTDISRGGKQDGIVKGKASSLWKEGLRLVEEVRPEYVIIENVGELISNGLGVVLRDLSRIGYNAEWRVITARSVGLYQQRERLFIVAYRSMLGCNLCRGQGLNLQINQEWESENSSQVGERRKFEPLTVCEVFPRGTIDLLPITYTDDERRTIRNLRRVAPRTTNELDAARRRERIRRIGNIVVPKITENIGHWIFNHWKRVKRCQEYQEL